MSRARRAAQSAEEKLEQAIGVAFKDQALLRLALTHRSYIHERPDEAPESNERLEFLGDAFLGQVTAEALYRQYPDVQEGMLTEYRAHLVRMESLAALASGLRLGDYLYLGHGEEASGGRTRPRNLARALEALIGALFMDRGYRVTRQWTLRLLGEALGSFQPEEVRDAKSVLQETVQAQGAPPPFYRTVSASGPEHQREFTVQVLVRDEALGKGRGASKREAQRAAATAALKTLVRRRGSNAG